MKITPTPEGGHLFEPENPLDSKILQDLINVGYLKSVNPKNKESEIIEIDFIQTFYPKDPGGARKYFATVLNLNDKSEDKRQREAAKNSRQKT